jgi:hypothetical protein
MNERCKLTIASIAAIALALSLSACTYSLTMHSTFRQTTPQDGQQQPPPRPPGPAVFEGAGSPTRPSGS